MRDGAGSLRIFTRQKLDLQADSQTFDQREAIIQQQSKEMNDMFNNLKTLTDAMQTIAGPHLLEATVNQAVGITEAQEEQGQDTSIGEDIAGT